MTQYKLTYFDFPGGRAEPIRIALHSGGIAFEDDRFAGSAFPALRESLPFKSVPVMEIDGAVVTQTNAMCRYVGKLTGLYPQDALQAMYCDEVLEACEHLSHHVTSSFGLQGDAMKSAREKLVDGWLSTFIKGLDGLLTRGGGEYFADGRLTMADLKAFMQTRTVQRSVLDHVPTDLVERIAPGLAAHRDRIASDPKVLAYYAQ